MSQGTFFCQSDRLLYVRLIPLILSSTYGIEYKRRTTKHQRCTSQTRSTFFFCSSRRYAFKLATVSFRSRMARLSLSSLMVAAASRWAVASSRLVAADRAFFNPVTQTIRLFYSQLQSSMLPAIVSTKYLSMASRCSFSSVHKAPTVSISLLSIMPGVAPGVIRASPWCPGRRRGGRERGSAGSSKSTCDDENDEDCMCGRLVRRVDADNRVCVRLVGAGDFSSSSSWF